MITEFGRHIKTINLLKLGSILSAVYLLYRALKLNIDYQDSWVLFNLEYEYIIFVLSYGLLFLHEKKPSHLLVYSIIGRIILFLIPNIKYSYFLGRSMDQQLQYVLSNGIINNNHISYSSALSSSGLYYVESPLIHISIATFSITSGLDLLNAFKYFPLFLNLLYPLYVYIILNKLNFNNLNYLKYSLILSVFDFAKGRVFLVIGIMIVFPFLLEMFNRYLEMINNQNRFNYIVLILVIIGSTMTHPIETLHFLVILLSVSIIINILSGLNKMFLVKQTIVGIVFNLGWILLRDIHFNYMSYLTLIGTATESIEATSSLLMRESIFTSIKVILSFYGSYALYSVFLLISLIFLYEKYRDTGDIGNDYKFILVFLFVVTLLTFLGYILSISFGYYERVFRNYYFVVLLISGYFFNHIKDNLGKKVLSIAIILVIVMSTIQLYDHPFLSPSASIIFPVEENVPIVYRGEVNSIYQRELVLHAQLYVRAQIASDAVTRNQIQGIVEGSYFDKYVTWHYPPVVDINPYVLRKEFDVFMLHLPGISGSFEERADIRDEATIIKWIYRQGLDLVFSNSQSFILHHR